MKTGKEIELEYSKQFEARVPELTPMSELIDRAIREAIVEQDKITRHACAEAIAVVDDNEDNDVVLGNAIRACMNVKAV